MIIKWLTKNMEHRARDLVYSHIAHIVLILCIGYLIWSIYDMS